MVPLQRKRSGCLFVYLYLILGGSAHYDKVVLGVIKNWIKHQTNKG